MSEEYSKDFKSLLLYLETCMVDSCGRIQGQKMNEEDFAIAKQMNVEGLIEFGRLRFHEDRELKRYNKSFPQYTHYVRFSDKAWILVHRFRRERSEAWILREVEKDKAYLQSGE